jgi:hypothetical protein
MTINEVGLVMRRWWWLIVALPVLGVASGVLMTRDQPFESSFRATVLIPGDTEIPGSAERPELMVMDDAPELVASRAFAEMVHAALEPTFQTELTVDDVHAALSGQRYSRVLTVTAARQQANEAVAVSAAAARVLPDAINQYLVANSDMEPATVQVIDPPSAAAKCQMERWIRIAAQGAAATGLAVVLALLLDAVFGTRVDRARQSGSLG